MADQEFEVGNGADFQETGAEYTEDPSFAGAVETQEAGGDASGGEKINASRNDDDERKIFVGGLSWETTVKDLKEYFGKYGEVLDCTLKTDPNTGRSRGFGFVLFIESSCVDQVVSEKTHMLHGRNIDPKRAKARGGREPIKKVFVGGLDPEVPEDTIRDHFGKFGKIEEIDLPYDKNRGQRRAFCFITFESEEIVDRVCDKNKQSIGGKEVDVKKATPKDQQGFSFGRGRGSWGGGGGGPGGRRGIGGYNQNWGNQNYDYNYYGNQGYGNYDYGNYGQGYGNYDYNSYYGNQGWGNYNQNYGGGYGGYGNNYGGYDYSGWYGTDAEGGNSGGQQASTYGKSRRGAGSNSGGGYHPYNR